MGGNYEKLNCTNLHMKAAARRAGFSLFLVDVFVSVRKVIFSALLSFSFPPRCQSHSEHRCSRNGFSSSEINQSKWFHQHKHRASTGSPSIRLICQQISINLHKPPLPVFIRLIWFRWADLRAYGPGVQCKEIKTSKTCFHFTEKEKMNLQHLIEQSSDWACSAESQHFVVWTAFRWHQADWDSTAIAHLFTCRVKVKNPNFETT